MVVSSLVVNVVHMTWFTPIMALIFVPNVRQTLLPSRRRGYTSKSIQRLWRVVIRSLMRCPCRPTGDELMDDPSLHTISEYVAAVIDEATLRNIQTDDLWEEYRADPHGEFIGELADEALPDDWQD
jgi:hypothetical protein